MRIGEVAQRSGVSVKTIRYYEDIGVLDLPQRSASGYREYDDNVLERLAFVRSAQTVGLKLGEIREIVAFHARGETPCAHVVALLAQHSAELSRRIAELENEIGCFFDRNPDGTLHGKAFAGQSFDRTVHKGDLTGIEIINRLMEQVWARSAIRPVEPAVPADTAGRRTRRGGGPGSHRGRGCIVVSFLGRLARRAEDWTAKHPGTFCFQ